MFVMSCSKFLEAANSLISSAGEPVTMKAGMLFCFSFCKVSTAPGMNGA